MRTEEISLENLFNYPTNVQLSAINECFNTINKLIVEKNGLQEGEDKFFAKLSNGNVEIGYIDNPEQADAGFHNNANLKFDIDTNLAFFQFVIFDGCKQWNLFEEIKMQGAPERNLTTKFCVPTNDIKYVYTLYTEK